MLHLVKLFIIAFTTEREAFNVFLWRIFLFSQQEINTKGLEMWKILHQNIKSLLKEYGNILETFFYQTLGMITNKRMLNI